MTDEKVWQQWCNLFGTGFARCDECDEPVYTWWQSDQGERLCGACFGEPAAEAGEEGAT